MSRRGQISIDKIVALRSSVLPLYVILKPDGSVTVADEVSEDGNDFLTTRMWGDQISFQSILGDYLSVEGDQVSTRRYCSADERFTVEKRDTQYSFRTRSGKYLSITDRPPFLGLAPTAEDTESFQLFSLMMYGVNIGKQLEVLERNGAVMIESLLPESEVNGLSEAVAQCGQRGENEPPSHETRVASLVGQSAGFAQLATHPIIMQLVRRTTSPRAKLSSMESCRTNAEFVRRELEQMTWHVVHPYSTAEFPGVMDARINFTVTWFLDELNMQNSTWAWVMPPLGDGAHLPRLPQLSSQEELQAIIRDAKPLIASRGSAWLYLGPVWMSNNAGAASFWRDYDAQTRYKHLSGQKEQPSQLGQSFRALTDAQHTAPTREELCPTIVQATYVREYVTPREDLPALEVLESYKERPPPQRILT
jgi:hypothetical protein